MTPEDKWKNIFRRIFYCLFFFYRFWIRSTTFHCRFREYTTLVLLNYLKHREHHLNISRNYHCGYKKCRQFFEREITLRTHLIRKHAIHLKPSVKKNIDAAQNANAKFVCTVPICKKELDTYFELVKHLKCHISSGLRVQCPFRSCTKEYDNWHSFTGHTSRIHKTAKNANSLNAETPGNEAHTTENDGFQHHDVESNYSAELLADMPASVSENSLIDQMYDSNQDNADIPGIYYILWHFMSTLLASGIDWIGTLGVVFA